MSQDRLSNYHGWKVAKIGFSIGHSQKDNVMFMLSAVHLGAVLKTPYALL
jgi:hypothetical protein